MIVKLPRVLKKKTLSKDIYANWQRVRAHLRESMEAWSKMCKCNFDSIYIRDWDWVAFRAVKNRNNWWLSYHSGLDYICRPSQCPGKHVSPNPCTTDPFALALRSFLQDAFLRKLLL